MRATIILKSEGLGGMHGERPWYRASAKVVDLDTYDHEDLSGSDGKTYRNRYWRQLWAGTVQDSADAATRQAAEWAAAQGLTLHRAPEGRGVTGAEADIEANYPGGRAAFLRDEADGHRPLDEALAAESGRIGGALPPD